MHRQPSDFEHQEGTAIRVDMMLLVADASASCQLPGLDELSDDRKKPRDEQGNCPLTPRGKIYRFVEVMLRAVHMLSRNRTDPQFKGTMAPKVNGSSQCYFAQRACSACANESGADVESLRNDDLAAT